MFMVRLKLKHLNKVLLKLVSIAAGRKDNLRKITFFTTVYKFWPDSAIGPYQ